METSTAARRDESSFGPRDVTPDEVEFFRSEGWAVLREFVDRGVIADLRERAERFLEDPAEPWRVNGPL